MEQNQSVCDFRCWFCAGIAPSLRANICFIFMTKCFWIGSGQVCSGNGCLQVLGKDPELHVCAAREALILRKLHHPNLVQLYGAWRDEVTTLVLEFAGATLAETQTPPPAQSVTPKVLLQIASALHCLGLGASRRQALEHCGGGFTYEGGGYSRKLMENLKKLTQTLEGGHRKRKCYFPIIHFSGPGGVVNFTEGSRPRFFLVWPWHTYFKVRSVHGSKSSARHRNFVVCLLLFTSLLECLKNM